MKANQIAAQLYTVREFLQTKDDVVASLKKIKDIGYAGVEFASISGIPETELAMLFKDAGLVCCSSHESSATITNDPQAIICRLQTMGVTKVAIPGPHLKLDSLEALQTFTAGVNAAGKVMKEQGLTLSYHNHSGEFRRVAGKLVLEHLYEMTDPQYCQSQLDTFWVQHGGGDTEDWCKKMKGRMPTIHIKDYGIGDDGKPMFFEVGYGNLTWKPIFTATEAAGVGWYIVEQDQSTRDPFESLKMSFEYLRDNHCS